MITKKKILQFIFLLVFLIALDQGSKTFLISHLKEQIGYTIELMPMLNIVYAWNHGISFGLFQNYYQYSNLIFLILNSFIISYLGYLAINSASCLSFLGLSIIVGGAIGNLIDRIFRGAVFDFIYFYYNEYSFPAFNLADSFITIGACFILYEYVFYERVKNSKKILDDQ